VSSIRTVIAGVIAAAAGGLAIAGQVRHFAGWQPVLLAWVVFLLLASWVVRSPDRPVLGRRAKGGQRVAAGSLVALVVAAAIAQAPGLFANPQTSADAYRSAWDGHVQEAGIDPYRYVPLDDKLGYLRDPVLFPGLGPQEPSGVTTPPRAGTLFAGMAPRNPSDRLTSIPRPEAGPVDPPAAIGLFAVIAKVTPASWGTRGVQAAAALLTVLTTLFIGVGLARDGRDSGLAVLYPASPVALFEAANNAHTEAFATAALVAAVVWSSRHLLAGALVGLAGALAFTPLLMLPAFTAAKVGATLRTWLGAAVVFVAGYVPHILIVGWLAAGYLPQYLHDQGYINGDRGYTILRLVPQLPADVVPYVALLLSVAAAVLALLWVRQHSVAATATWLYGTALLITTPAGPWHSLPLAALAVLSGRLEWLAVPIAAYGAALYTEHGIQPGWYAAGAALLVITCGIIRAAVGGPAAGVSR
jgi:hypothetical protein